MVRRLLGIALAVAVASAAVAIGGRARQRSIIGQGGVILREPLKYDYGDDDALLSAMIRHPVNINTADATTLAAGLNGIGPSKAQAIVAYRDANGPFQSADQLASVKGIGLATVEKNRDRIEVDAATRNKSK